MGGHEARDARHGHTHAAAAVAARTIFEKAMMVTSVPVRSIFALPIGSTKSLDCASSDIG